MRPVPSAIHFFRTTSLCLCLLIISGSIGWAREAALSGIVLTRTQEKLFIFTTIQYAFTEEMEAALKSGIPASFLFFVRLKRDKRMWFDKTLVEKEETHTLTYDPLKGMYAVTRSWENESPFITASFKEACDRMCKIEGLPLTRTDRLKKGTTYGVENGLFYAIRIFNQENQRG